jgi:tetratricopeptide (TPR) repeat protein
LIVDATTEIGRKVRALRLAKGLSQRQLAGQEMTRNLISLIEAGKVGASRKTLCAIAERLGVQVDYFFTASAAAVPEMAILPEEALQLFHAGKFQRAMKLLQQTLLVAGNPKVLAEARLLLGKCLRRLQRGRQAVSEFDQAVEAFASIRDQTGVIEAGMQRGAALFGIEAYEAARQSYEQVLLYTGGQKRFLDERVAAYTYLGTTLLRLGRLDDAIESYRKGYGLGPEGWEARGQLALGLGAVFDRKRCLHESLKWTQTAIDCFAAMQSDSLMLATHNRAVLEVALGLLDQAECTFMDCLAFYRSRGQVALQVSALEELGSIAVQRWDWPAAEERAWQALGLLEETDDAVMRGRIYRLMGQAKFGMGDCKTAYLTVRGSYDLFRRIGAAHEAETSHKLLAVIRQSFTPG